MTPSFIQINDNISIAYQWVMPREKKSDFTLVFLHEALGSIGQWRRFPQLLCDALGARGLMYERQGYGASSPLTSQRDSSYLEKYALEEMPQVMAQLLPNEKILLVGHSDGGSIALMYGAKYPQNVIGMVTMAAHVIVEDVTVQGIYPAIQAYNEGKLDGLKKYHGDKTETLFHAWSQTWISEEYQSWNICDKIAQDTPSLIIQGENDEYGTEKQVDLILEKVPNGQKAMLAGIHHQPHLEDGEQIVALITKWYNADRNVNNR